MLYNEAVIENWKKRKSLIITIQLLVAALHVVGIGRHSTESMFIFSASYFSDLVLAFGFYFLLILLEKEVPILKRRWLKGLLIFFTAAVAEVLQYFNIYALGRTFDPLDFLCYALGVLAAIGLDAVLSKTVRFWRIEENNSKNMKVI